MIFGGIIFRESVAFAFFGNHMNQSGGRGEIPDRAEDLDHLGYIVSIDGPQIAQPHILEQFSGNQDILDSVIEIGYNTPDTFSDIGTTQKFPDFRFYFVVSFVCEDPCKIP